MHAGMNQTQVHRLKVQQLIHGATATSNHITTLLTIIAPNSEMTYIVSTETLNSSTPYHTIARRHTLSTADMSCHCTDTNATVPKAVSVDGSPLVSAQAVSITVHDGVS